MKKLIRLLSLVALASVCIKAYGQARVMNPGEAVGQLVILSMQDVREESDKFKSLNPLSIPVFAELPMELSVVSGTITLAQQNLLSHIQIKSRARGTPNLDISGLEGGLENELFQSFADGDWVRMVLGQDGSILIEPSTEQAAMAFYESKSLQSVELVADLQTTTIFRTEEMSWQDFDKVGAKAANYAELANVLNTPERTVVPHGFAIPFYYYEQFVQMNPPVAAAIAQILRDPLMNRLARTSYRQEKLEALRDLIESDMTVVDPNLVDLLINTFDQVRDPQGLPRRMKLRSSTNAEDLPNFNGAGLYSSESYKPEKDGEEKSLEKKRKSLIGALKEVWASIWNLRAFEERAYFRIPHEQVKMGIQVNPSFRAEDVDGVVITKNITDDPNLQGRGVYIEAQRGDDYSVANPIPGIKPERILVLVNEADVLDQSRYQIHVLQKSNIGDDNLTILPIDNPNPIMTDAEIKDLVYQVLKAEAHFKPLLGADDPDFSLDLEFKVDSSITGIRAVYLKQARPYID